MKKNSLLPYFVIFLVVLVSRIPLLEKFQSHWDGPDYSIAIIRYSLEQHTPSAPGYPLYIAIGKFFHLFISNLHISILLVSILACIVGAFAFYTYGKQIYNKYVGTAAVAIFLTGSPFYFLSLTPYGYLLIASLTVSFALVVYRIFILNKQNGIIFGFLLGLCFGVRPQEILLFGPLAILGFIFLSNKNKLLSSLIFFTITLSWIIPLIIDSGGFQNYLKINLASATAPGFAHPFTYNLPLAIKGLLLSFGISIFFLAYFPYKLLTNKIKTNKKVVLFYLIWIIPGLFFNLFVRGEHAGPQLGYLSAILIIISYSIWRVTKNNKVLFYICVITIVSFNLFWFFFDRDPSFANPFRPTSFHYSDIRKNDLKTGSKVNYVINNYNPKDTLLIAADVLWRPYSYHLKDFQIIAPFALESNQSPYNYTLYEGKDWNIKRLVQKDFVLKIPKSIKKIVVMDDSGYVWVQNKTKRKISLPGNTILTVIDVLQNTTLYYDYHTIFLRRDVKPF